MPKQSGGLKERDETGPAQPGPNLHVVACCLGHGRAVVSGPRGLAGRFLSSYTSCFPLPVIRSFSEEELDLIEGSQPGANSYVRKPVDFGQFSEAVRQLGLYWLVLNEPPPQTVRS